MATVPTTANVTVSEAQAGTLRRNIFLYDIVALAVLAVIPIWYVEQRFWSIRNLVPVKVQATLTVHCIWLGALGGVAISLKGIYDHGAREWQRQYDIWHIGRPISGAIAGGITYLLLLAVSKSQPLEPVALAAAFIMGTQEKRFFNFLYEVARLIVQVPGEDGASALTVTEIRPTQGATGTMMTILGTGFDAGVAVTIGDKRLTDVIVNKDGTSITGMVPAGSGSATIIVVNPDGTARSVSAGFTYLALNPTSLSFGNQAIGGTSDAQTITFTNTGAAQTKISAVALSGTNTNNFMMDATSCINAVVEPGATCTVSVRFAPTDPPGEKSATVTITTDTSGLLTASLSGTAT